MNADPRETLAASPMGVLQIIAVALTIGLTALDGFDVLSISFASPGIATEWGIDRAALGVVLSAELFGMAIGSIVLGGVADRIGRRPTMLGCLLLMTAGMFMVTTVRGIPELEIWRVVTGLGIGGLLAAGNAVAAEFANHRRRNLCVALMAIGYPLGAVVGGTIVAQLLHGHDWRVVFYLGGCTTALFLPLVYWFIPESVHWLAQKQPGGALDRINATLHRMGHGAIAALPVIAEQVRKRSVSDIFAPALIRTTVLTAAAYFCHVMTFYFILKWVPKIVADMHFPASAAAGVLVWTNVGGALGGAALGLLTTRLGLKPVTIAVMLLSTVMVVVFGRSGADLQQLSLLCACAGFCTNAAIVGLYAIFAQAYPTHVRATGTGFAIGIGRGGAALAPIAAGYLFKWGYGLPTVSLYMALGSLFAAGILAMLRLKPDQPTAMTLLRSASS
ncbi:MAG TPA: MFS transporter [Steroidobacteraceae bacterium]|nr:MFS transporter [Steroidobacteraceae bacterium]